MPYRVQRDYAFAWLLAALPLPCGLIISMLNERFTSRSWRFASGIPGGYSLWGGVLIVLGVAMIAALIAAQFRIAPRGIAAAYVAAILNGVWWVMLGGVFIYVSLTDPLANPLGGVAWTWIGLLYWTWAWFERRRFTRP